MALVFRGFIKLAILMLVGLLGGGGIASNDPDFAPEDRILLSAH